VNHIITTTVNGKTNTAVNLAMNEKTHNRRKHVIQLPGELGGIVRAYINELDKCGMTDVDGCLFFPKIKIGRVHACIYYLNYQSYLHLNLYIYTYILISSLFYYFISLLQTNLPLSNLWWDTGRSLSTCFITL
jgi:hypothetical protein